MNNVENLAFEVTSQKELTKAKEYFFKKGYKMFTPDENSFYHEEYENLYVLLYHNMIHIAASTAWIKYFKYKIVKINPQMEFDFE